MSDAARANLDIPIDEKYIVFNREDFYVLLGQMALPPWTAPDGTLVGSDWDCAPIAQQAGEAAERTAIRDAVVIRRQDYFASPCLATYAAMIALVAKREADPKMKANLLDISDYFERQAQLAAEEGWKLPDL